MSVETNQTAVDISLLVCTYNRCNDLRELLETALTQDVGDQFTYEIVVVDNNSNDDTRHVVQSFIDAGHKNLRYFFEPRQGRSYALNLGLNQIRGWGYIITDDDFVLPPDWVRNIYEGFRDNPEMSFVSGKVLPLWQGEVPSWLDQRHWSALAVVDYGETAFVTDTENQICQLACAFKVDAVKAVGGYHNDLGVQGTRIGGTEDVDLLTRLWKSGRKGLYLPHIHFLHKMTKERLTKKYHRRWHKGHGRSYAVMRAEETEKGTLRFLGVPAYMYRQAVRDALACCKLMLMRRTDEAFWHEIQLHFFSGFLTKRCADYFTQRRNESRLGSAELT